MPAIKTLVSDLMTTPATIVGPDVAAGRIAALLSGRDSRYAVVTDDGGWVLGIVSATDLERLGVRRGAAPDHPPASLTAGEIMSVPVATVHYRQDVSIAAGRIGTRSFHALPVVDDEHTVIGILTADDLLRRAYLEVPT